MRKRFTLVEEVLDVNADRYWYYIPGFNGYEISNDGYIRSMKHYKKYPFGLLIQPKKNRDGIIHPEDPIYELSNNNNERTSVNFSKIRNLAETNKYHITGYPRRTNIIDIASRNQRCCIKQKQVPSQIDKTLIYPKFTIIEDESISEEKRSDIICPIEFII